MRVEASFHPVGDADSATLERGAVLRIATPDSVFDAIIAEDAAAESGYALVVTTGYKAGLVLARLPADARSVGAPGISASWLLRQSFSWFAGAVTAAPSGYRLE